MLVLGALLAQAPFLLPMDPLSVLRPLAGSWQASPAARGPSLRFLAPLLPWLPATALHTLAFLTIPCSLLLALALCVLCVVACRRGAAVLPQRRAARDARPHHLDPAAADAHPHPAQAGLRHLRQLACGPDPAVAAAGLRAHVRAAAGVGALCRRQRRCVASCVLMRHAP